MAERDQSEFVVHSTIFVDGLKQEGMNPDWLETTVKPAIAELQSALSWFHGEAERARSSQLYSPRGLQQKLRALADEAAAKWPKTTASLATLKKRVTQAETAMQPTTEEEGVTKQLLQYLKEKEVRDVLRGKDPLEVRIAYLDAVESGDTLIINAIEHAPATPLVDRQTIDESRARRWSLANPQAATELHQLQRLVDVLDSLARVAERELHQQTGLQADEGNGVTMLE